MIVTTETKGFSKALKLSAVFFIVSALFDIISNYSISIGLIITWLIVKELAFFVFVWLLSKGKQLSKEAEGQLNFGMVCIVLMIILDIILWIGIFSGWEFIWYGFGAIIFYFAIDIFGALGFSLAYFGFKKIDRKMSNPAYLLYGWGALLFEIIFWSSSIDSEEAILTAEFWVLLILLIMIAVIQLVRSEQVKNLGTAEYTTSTVYTPYQSYQQPAQESMYQPLKPQSADTIKFCENCGSKLEADARYCVNCGSKTE